MYAIRSYYAAERERHVAYPATGLSVWQVLLDPTNSFNEINRIVVMLFHTCTDGQDIRVENDVLGREIQLFGQQFIGRITSYNVCYTKLLRLAIVARLYASKVTLFFDCTEELRIIIDGSPSMPSTDSERLNCTTKIGLSAKILVA